VSDQDPENYAEALSRARAGFAFLTETLGPRWPAYVDRTTLDMSSSRDCIAAQLGRWRLGVGDPNLPSLTYMAACRVLFPDIHERSVKTREYGLIAGNGVNYVALQKAWLEVLEGKWTMDVIQRESDRYDDHGMFADDEPEEDR
jgi:hypothetical protein